MRSNVAAVLFWIFSIVLDTDLLVPTDVDRLEIVSRDELEALTEQRLITYQNLDSSTTYSEFSALEGPAEVGSRDE